MNPRVNPVYAFRPPPELAAGRGRCTVAIVGAGPVGLVAALDLAQRGIRAVLLDDDCTVSVGSRAICYAKRTLEILNRLGCGEAVASRGVQWSVGRVFFGNAQAYRFDLQDEPGQRWPAFVNLQQYHLEEILVDRAVAAGVDVRWRSEVTGVVPAQDGMRLRVATPGGSYDLDADWVIAADGTRGVMRRLLGIETQGQVFADRFLIADVRMRSSFPTERWFWFDPPFHPGQSVLLHRQGDDVWRVDFQLGPDVDPEAERQPERIGPRLRAMFGADVDFELAWASVYTFRCQRMARFVHGRVIFAGDAAHLVSPFGARGANSGMQDADNLAWKLALVAQGRAPERLLESYDRERTRAADENILHSTRATDFISPKTPVARLFRNAALELARRHPFARRLVNSGRLSTPTALLDSPLSTADAAVEFDARAAGTAPGMAAVDAPVAGPRGGWLLDYLGDGFTLLSFGALPGAAAALLGHAAIYCGTVCVEAEAPAPALRIEDPHALLAQRYAARPGTCYLFRPDQHVCARWRAFDAHAVQAAIARATGAP